MSADKQGRNDPCACGSGKKYKQCCMRQPAAKPWTASSQARAALATAVASFEAGHYQAAVTICQRILQADPTNFEAMTLLGVLAFYAGNVDVAIRLLEQSLSINPQQADAHNNLGEILRATGKFQPALMHFEQALKTNNRHLGALINCGNALQDIYRYEDAIAAYKRALQIQPDHAGALSNLANIYQQLYRHQDAIATFSALLQVDADYDWALGGAMYSRIHCCDWDGYAHNVAEIIDQINAGKRPVKVFELRPMSDDPALELKCARVFAEAMYPVDTAASAIAMRKLSPGEKIKIAYLSADFREHPVSQLLVEVLEQHDRSAFEVIGVSFGPDDTSPLRVRVAQAFDQFVDVRQHSDTQVVALLRGMQVDIAIDLMGYTTHARPGILSQRAAPVQISYLGYSGTTGSAMMDYIIGDETIIPVEHEPYFSEQVLRLPAPLLPRDTKLQAGYLPTRAEAGLPEHGFVFCVFNNHYKISPSVFDAWMRLLSAVEGSVLWLSAANAVVTQNLQNEAEKRGVSSSRLIFAHRTKSLADHIARHALADLFLDTHPYNAHTTASDALWAGLPVVTYQGAIFSARVAASLLRSLSLPELVTQSLADYEQLALSLAQDSARLGSIKARLLQNKQALPAFDAKSYASNLEALYRLAVKQSMPAGSEHA